MRLPRSRAYHNPAHLEWYCFSADGALWDGNHGLEVIFEADDTCTLGSCMQRRARLYSWSPRSSDRSTGKLAVSFGREARGCEAAPPPVPRAAAEHATLSAGWAQSVAAYGRSDAQLKATARSYHTVVETSSTTLTPAE
jgi:hypothetical protein